MSDVNTPETPILDALVADNPEAAAELAALREQAASAAHLPPHSERNPEPGDVWLTHLVGGDLAHTCFPASKLISVGFFEPGGRFYAQMRSFGPEPSFCFEPGPSGRLLPALRPQSGNSVTVVLAAED